MRGPLASWIDRQGVPTVAGVGVALVAVLVLVASVSVVGVVGGVGEEQPVTTSDDRNSSDTAFTSGDSSLLDGASEHGPAPETAPAVSVQPGQISTAAGGIPSNPVGDADDDSGISIADAQAIANYVIGNSPSSFDRNLANVTRSGDGVQIADAQRVAEYTIAAVDPANTRISGFGASTTIETNTQITGNVTVANTGGMGTIQGVYYRVATDESFQSVVYEERVDVVDLAPAGFSGNETTVQFTVDPAVSGGEYTQGLFSEGLESNNASVVANLTVESGLYAGGNGTAANPYEIADWTHLDNVRGNLSANFTLVSDLDNETEGYEEVAGPSANNGSGFEPIGDVPPTFSSVSSVDENTEFGSTEGDGPGFAGTFDGNGHVIEWLNITRPGEDEVGLFGYASGTSTITDVGIEDGNVTGYRRVGGLVAFTSGNVTESYAKGDVKAHFFGAGGLVGRNEGEVSRSYATGHVEGEQNRIGGLVGFNHGGKVTKSRATGDVSGSYQLGGLVGSNFDPSSSPPGVVTESYATGNATGDDEVGGLVGRNGGEVTNSNATGDTEGSGQIGGLVGSQDSGTVTESYATGDVSGTSEVGGLTGRNAGPTQYDNDGTVTESYATGNVTGDSEVGGLIGRNPGNVTESYATGNVTGTSSVGGLVGKNSDSVSDSYWDIDTTGQIGSAGGTGLNTSDMKGGPAESNMGGFDFTGTWEVVNATVGSDQRNVSYPYLSNNTQDPAPGLETVYDGGALTFDDASVGDTTAGDWYVYKDTSGAQIEIKGDRSTTAGQSQYIAGDGNLNDVQVGINVNLTGVETLRIDSYVQSRNPSIGEYRIRLANSNFDSTTHNNVGQWDEDVIDFSGETGEDVLLIHVRGDQEIYWDNFRFFNEDGYQLPPSEVVTG